MSLIHSLCIMLETTPFHKENYSRLIIGVIVQYYQQCSARFRGAFWRDGTKLTLRIGRPGTTSQPALGADARATCSLGSARRLHRDPYRDEIRHGELSCMDAAK